MRKLTLIALASLFAANLAFADASCEAKAVDKNGKPLHGAAKTSFIKKCEKGNTMAAKSDCASMAVDKNGKPLKGAAKNASIKKCEKDAAGK
jgi:hypothetical protein